MKIVLDCFGGDNSPFAQVDGAVRALKTCSDINVVLVGKANEINSELEKYEFDENRIEVLNADDVVSCDDKPTVAIRDKKNSSMAVAFDLLKNDNDCSAMVSTGSTGALLVGAVMKIGRIKGVSRPALTPLLPTFTGGNVMLVDCGANVDCKPVNLLHFALMGSVYFREILGIKKPRLAILSNGTEPEKGNELTKQAYELIKNLPDIEFCGNMEARDILSGNYDIIVSDGFNGNIALKSCEGAIKTVLKLLKTEIKSSFWAKIGALLMKKQFKNIKKRMDYESMGGAVVLGAEKVVIKAHGSAKADAICNSLIQANTIAKADVISKIKSGLQGLEIENEI